MTGISKKILIVDDDKDFTWIMRQSLVAEGFYVVTAKDGEEGLAVAEKEKPDLILLDIAMPKMDGIATAKKLKEAKNNAPIIFLTNMQDEGHIGGAVEAVSKTDYIIKSDLGVDEIIGRIKIRLNFK